MSDTTDFLAKRRAEVEAALAAIDAQAAPLRAELAELRKAEGALSGGLIHTRRDTLQAQVLDALAGRTGGLDVASIREALVAAGRPVTRESLSPQLSRLVAAGKLARDDGRYVLPALKGETDAG